MSSIQYDTDTWTVRREMQFIAYHTQQMADAWQGKAAAGAIVAWASAVVGVQGAVADCAQTANDAYNAFITQFGGDSTLLLLLFGLVCFDFALGLFRAIFLKHNGTREFSWIVFKRGIAKYPTYCLYIFLVGAMNVFLSHSWGVGPFLLTWFTSYLGANEIFSIIKNLERCGVKVPPLLLFMAHGFRNKIERALHDSFLKDGDKSPTSPPTQPNPVPPAPTPPPDNGAEK